MPEAIGTDDLPAAANVQDRVSLAFAVDDVDAEAARVTGLGAPLAMAADRSASSARSLRPDDGWQMLAGAMTRRRRCRAPGGRLVDWFRLRVSFGR
jgi:hypothetical protein